MEKEFKRSKTDRYLFGICGGLAEYTETDVTLWRILFTLLIFTTIPIIFLYVLTTIITD